MAAPRNQYRTSLDLVRVEDGWEFRFGEGRTDVAIIPDAIARRAAEKILGLDNPLNAGAAALAVERHARKLAALEK